MLLVGNNNLEKLGKNGESRHEKYALLPLMKCLPEKSIHGSAVSKSKCTHKVQDHNSQTGQDLDPKTEISCTGSGICIIKMVKKVKKHHDFYGRTQEWSNG